MAWFGRPQDEQRGDTGSGITTAEIEALDAYSRTIIGAVNKVGPAVVQIGVRKAVMERSMMGVMRRQAEGAGSGDAAGAGSAGDGDAAGASLPVAGVWASTTLAGRDRNRAVVNAMGESFI